MNNIIKSFLATVALLATVLSFTSPVLHAQATTTQTALSAAITSANASTFIVNSTTGFTANSTNAVIDAEQMAVIAVNTTTNTITVVRGISGTRATTHASGAIVYVGPPNYFTSYPRTGSCTAANELNIPIINASMREYYTCVSGDWRRADLTADGGYLTQSVTSGGVPTSYSCGATSGNANCANTQTGHTAHYITGVATLSAGSAIISSISPTFTSTSTGACVGVDTSGGSGVVAEVIISGVSSITVNGTGSGTVSWLCAGY